MKSGIILAWFVLPSTPEKLASIVEKAHEGLYAMAAPEYDWEKVPKTVSLFSTSTRLNYSYALKLSVDRSGDMFRRIHAIYLRTMVKQRGCRIMIALRRYKNINGDWPQSLDDIRNITLADNLVDPSNGLSFVYKLTDDGFTLYSKGKNGIDENGEIKDTWPIAEPDDWLIWPQPGRTRKNSTLDKE